MDPKSIPPPIARAISASAQYAARSREGLVAGIGDLRAANLRAPAREEHARRFLYGLTLPVTLWRVSARDPKLRASMKRRLVPPALFVALWAAIGIASLAGTLATSWRDPSRLAADAGVDSAKVERDDSRDDDDKTPGEIQAAGPEAKARAKRAAPSPLSGRLRVLHLMADVATSRLAKLVGTLSVIEWILVWIGREHHDVLAHEASRLTGVPAEPCPDPPRLRLDLGWLRMKSWRALRFLLFLALDAPLVWLAGMIPGLGGALGLLVEGAWFAYWTGVFAIANSFLAWEGPIPGGWAPWFVRALLRVGRVPFLGLPFRLYARVLTRVTRNVWPACLAFEDARWESLGLALVRGVASVPVLYILSRPMFTVAATHALVARRPAAAGPG
jgi:hypothetical protein